MSGARSGQPLRGRRSWVDDLHAGALVRFKSGVVRTCLQVSKKGDRLVCAVFPIRRCSWTERGYTYMDRWKLRTHARGVAGLRKTALDTTPLARKLLADMRQSAADPYVVKCCDVIGVFS